MAIPRAIPRPISASKSACQLLKCLENGIARETNGAIAACEIAPTNAHIAASAKPSNS